MFYKYYLHHLHQLEYQYLHQHHLHQHHLHQHLHHLHQHLHHLHQHHLHQYLEYQHHLYLEYQQLVQSTMCVDNDDNKDIKKHISDVVNIDDVVIE